MPISTLIWEESQDQLQTVDEDETWEEGLQTYIFAVLLELNSLRESRSGKEKSTAESIPSCSLLGKSSTEVVFKRLYSGTSLKFIDITKLELRCANADPNYGPLWFYCRSGPTETARNVLARAVNLVVDEVKSHAYLYIMASIRRLAVISRFQQKGRAADLKEGSSSWEKAIDQELLSVPSLKAVITQGTKDMSTDVELSESSIPASNLISGIAELSQHHPIQKLTLHERRKKLFGVDSLFS